jgi:Flagellar hook capping protein
MIEIAWNPSTDADGDSIGYGFILFAGQYSVSTPALFAVDVPITALPIPHSVAVSLLETAGYQSITCDWMVFATDGQDTTASAEIRTITIDARPVLSTDELAIPEVFALHQNYPNPFNPTTTIKYDLPQAQNVQVMIYDIMGRKVRTLVNEFQDIGYRTIQWNAADDFGRPVSAGMYVYTIQAGDFRQVKKMVLLK